MTLFVLADVATGRRGTEGLVEASLWACGTLAASLLSAHWELILGIACGFFVLRGVVGTVLSGVQVEALVLTGCSLVLFLLLAFISIRKEEKWP